MQIVVAFIQYTDTLINGDFTLFDLFQAVIQLRAAFDQPVILIAQIGPAARILRLGSLGKFQIIVLGLQAHCPDFFFGFLEHMISL